MKVIRLDYAHNKLDCCVGHGIAQSRLGYVDMVWIIVG